MLLTVPTEILLAILVIAIALGIIFVMLVAAHNAKAQKEIDEQPERIQKKSDAPNTED